MVATILRDQSSISQANNSTLCVVAVSSFSLILFVYCIAPPPMFSFTSIESFLQHYVEIKWY